MYRGWASSAPEAMCMSYGTNIISFLTYIDEEEHWVEDGAEIDQDVQRLPAEEDPVHAEADSETKTVVWWIVAFVSLAISNSSLNIRPSNFLVDKVFVLSIEILCTNVASTPQDNTSFSKISLYSRQIPP